MPSAASGNSPHFVVRVLARGTTPLRVVIFRSPIAPRAIPPAPVRRGDGASAVPGPYDTVPIASCSGDGFQNVV